MVLRTGGRQKCFVPRRERSSLELIPCGSGPHWIAALWSLFANRPLSLEVAGADMVLHFRDPRLVKSPLWELIDLDFGYQDIAQYYAPDP